MLAWYEGDGRGTERELLALGKFERPVAGEYPRGDIELDGRCDIEPDGRGADCGLIDGPAPRPASGPIGDPETFDRGPFCIPDRIPFMPPALGGRGTERDQVDDGPRMLLLGEAPRLGIFIGRCTPALPMDRPLLFIAPGRVPNPPRAPTFALALAFPRMAEGVEIRLTTGREKLRGGGAAAIRPAFGPSMLVRVGRTFSERTGLILLIWFGETRIAFRATDCEFSSVLRETAVNPFGACMFA